MINILKLHNLAEEIFMILGGILNLIELGLFQFILLFLYHDLCPGSKIPWANAVKKIEFIKFFKKIGVSLVLVFDPSICYPTIYIGLISILNLTMVHTIVVRPYFQKILVYCIESICIMSKAIYGIRVFFVVSISVKLTSFYGNCIFVSLLVLFTFFFKERKVQKIISSSSILLYRNEEEVQEIFYLILKWVQSKGKVKILLIFF
jgi:hypothetical protein